VSFGKDKVQTSAFETLSRWGATTEEKDLVTKVDPELTITGFFGIPFQNPTLC